ncbi:MAG: insulinase family protein [Bacteroidales bacterium]|nr:insulinase family protein [Bacteroidales bacterium]
MSSFQRIQPQVHPFDAQIDIPLKSLALSNGARLYMIEAGTEDVIRIECIFRAGMIKEHLPLLASSTNMMLTEGSERYTSEELNALLDYYGIFFNLQAERDTAGLTAYFLSRYFDKALELLAEVLFSPVFPAKELEKLMKKRLNWFRINREKVQNIASERFFESIFGPGHPYGRMVSEPDFKVMTPSLLRDFHSRLYRPEEMAVIVSGKIPGSAVDSLEKHFGGLRSEKIQTIEKQSIIKGSPVRKEHIKKKGAVQTAIRIGAATINKRHPDYPGLKFLNVILGGYFGSRLMKNIREEKGYTYGIHSIVSSFDKSGFRMISTDVGRENAGKAIDEITKEINILLTTPVPADEIEVVSNYMAGELVRLFDGPMSIAESFKSAWEFGLDLSYFSTIMHTIRTITPEELLKLANTYYTSGDIYEITAG